MTFMVSVDQDGRTPMEEARGTTANREMAEFREKILFHSMTMYNKENKTRRLAVRALYWCSNENERDHGERSRWKKRSMDIPEVAKCAERED